MRILWLVRHNLEQSPGGDTTQIIQTKNALERLGVAVELADQLPRTPTGFDVVHLFHLDRLWEHVATCRTLRARGIPTVLSTIYWPSDDFDRGGRQGLQGWLARTLGSDRYQALRQLQRGAMHITQRRAWSWPIASFQRAARFVLNTASTILPNSTIEREVIERKFGVIRPAIVVPNAVDLETFDNDRPPPVEPRSGVLCVGRIEPRKNQLGLIRAMRQIDAQLTFVGSAGRFNKRYERDCRDKAGPNVRFIEHTHYDQLAALYRTALVHANTSWYETPGLASLEAALCGCALVVSTGGSTREYFGDQAAYCEPHDEGSIRRAIETALARPPTDDLPQRIRREYNWDRAAEATLRGYELATACVSERT